MVFLLASPVFEDGGTIPARYTCDAVPAGRQDRRDLSPALSIVGVPEGTVSLALVMDDPDIPQAAREARGIDAWDHWTLFDLPPGTAEIPEGGLPQGVGTAGVNTNGTNAYTGPCPPPDLQPPEHRYVFALYALDALLGLPEGATKAQVLAAMEGHVLASTSLTGRYKRIAQ